MARILAIDSYLPPSVETDEMLGRENPDWDMQKLYHKSGIRERHIAAPHETAADLAYEAGRRLLARGCVETESIDYLLFCTQSPDHFLPASACILQDRLGLGTHVGAMDCNLGCSGYVYGLQLAKCLVDGGMARHVLLLTADTCSKFIHPRDRMLRTLFSDAAAATLVGPCDGTPGRLDTFVVGTDGRGAENLIVPSGGLRLPRSAETAVEVTDESGCVRSQDHMYMNGAAIFGFAITVVPAVVANVLQSAGLAPEDVDWYVYHQANKYMLDNLAMRSGVPEEKMVLAMEDVGNTLSASIPIAIQRYVEAGRIRQGQRLLMIGFGVGYSWAACVATWAPQKRAAA